MDVFLLDLLVKCLEKENTYCRWFNGDLPRYNPLKRKKTSFVKDMLDEHSAPLKNTLAARVFFSLFHWDVRCPLFHNRATTMSL